MPDTTLPTDRPADETFRPAGRAAEMKWLVVFAALLVGIVVDGVAVSDLSHAAKDAASVSEQAVITLPSDRCGPGCTIMMASR